MPDIVLDLKVRLQVLSGLKATSISNIGLCDGSFLKYFWNVSVMNFLEHIPANVVISRLNRNVNILTELILRKGAWKQTAMHK